MSEYDPNAPKESYLPAAKATTGAVRELLVVVANLSTDPAVKEKLQWHLDRINGELEKTVGGGWEIRGPKP